MHGTGCTGKPAPTRHSAVLAAQFLEDVDDEILDPDIAIKWLEWVSYLLNQLSEEDRRAVVTLCRARMDHATDPWMRKALEGLYSGCGLDQDN